jgi:general L-amino acid transport system permease protein
VIPGIVNTFIGLFKDTTLVLIIGLFDLPRPNPVVLHGSDWSSPPGRRPALSCAPSSSWIFCFGMSRYSIYHGAKLTPGTNDNVLSARDEIAAPRSNDTLE